MTILCLGSAVSLDISSREYSSFFILDTFLRESVATEAFFWVVQMLNFDRSQPEAISLQQKISYTLTKSMEYTVIANSPWILFNVLFHEHQHFFSFLFRAHAESSGGYCGGWVKCYSCNVTEETLRLWFYFVICADLIALGFSPLPSPSKMFPRRGHFSLPNCLVIFSTGPLSEENFFEWEALIMWVKWSVYCRKSEAQDWIDLFPNWQPKFHHLEQN